MTGDAATGSGFAPVEVRLRNGQYVKLRSVVQQDKDALHAAVKQLSPESRYARFMSPLHELSPEMLDRAVNPETGCDMQIVAVSCEGSQEIIVGGARYSANPGSKDCEFALAIIDDWQGLGLASHLLGTLVQTACTYGFERMEGYILATNTRMLNLAKKFGFVEIPSPEGPTVRLIQKNLRQTGEEND